MQRPRPPRMAWRVGAMALVLLGACGTDDAADPATDAATAAKPDSQIVVPDAPDPAADTGFAETNAPDVPPKDPNVPDAGPIPVGPRQVPPPTYSQSNGRVVAIGDVHGDINALRQALGLAGLIDNAGDWVGGNTVLVQVGDQLDRGDNEREILDWLEGLAEQAHQAGGVIHILLGNHETMNVEEDFRYVTDGGWADFADVPHDSNAPALAGYAANQRGRVAAFLPGGPYAELLAGHNITTVVDDTIFVHGGILPDHVGYGLERLNADVSAWMRGDAARPNVLSGDGSPVWSRHYSQDVDPADCSLLREALDAVPAARMVVAHTVQSVGINSECGGLVWRVDVGLASYYGGPSQALQILGDKVQILQ